MVTVLHVWVLMILRLPLLFPQCFPKLVNNVKNATLSQCFPSLVQTSILPHFHDKLNQYIQVPLMTILGMMKNLTKLGASFIVGPTLNTDFCVMSLSWVLLALVWWEPHTLVSSVLLLQLIWHFHTLCHKSSYYILT